jgi:hypothetical protein
MKRRDFLRASAAGGAAALGASTIWTKRAQAVPFGETPDKHLSSMLPETARAESVLECFLYGGLTTWETFYCVPEFGEATNTWAWAHRAQMVAAVNDANRCNYGIAEEDFFTPFANDSSGRPIFLGPYLKPLLERPDVLNRMRIVVNRHTLSPHEAAIPLAASGRTLGNPALAGLGTHVGRYFVERDTNGSHPPPFAYGFATGDRFIPNDGILSLVAQGHHPGQARPLLVKVDSIARLQTLLARTKMGSMDQRQEFDQLMGLYFQQYQSRLKFGSQEEMVRAAKFNELLQAQITVTKSTDIEAVLDPALFAPVHGSYCSQTNNGSGVPNTGNAITFGNLPDMSLALATHLLNHPTYPAKFATVVDVGLRQADGGGGYDTHSEAPITQSRNLGNFLNVLLKRIKTPDEPAETAAGKIDLDKTMVVFNMEFGRAPGRQNNGNGRNHWPNGYVQIYFGGPIGPDQKGIYGQIEESGQAKIFTTPAENRIATLLAMGIWPFDAASYSGSDVQGQTEEGAAARNVIKRILGHEVA